MVESARSPKTDQDDCTHHWRIGTPSGETSTGVCKICGASRQFQNYSYRPSMTRSRRSLVDNKSSK
jgi:hypothetical protein